MQDLGVKMLVVIRYCMLCTQQETKFLLVSHGHPAHPHFLSHCPRQVSN